MIEIGRLCVKTAGRDAGCHCVVIEILDNNYVMIDGETRRRKCNISHLEPKSAIIKIEKNISHEEIKKEFEKLGLKARDTKSKQKTEKPARKRKVKAKVEKASSAKESKSKEKKKPSKKKE